MDGVFVDVSVILAGAESTIFLFDREKRDACGELDGWIFPEARFLLRKSLVAFHSSEEMGVYLSYFWGKGVVQVDLMVIWLGRGNVVGSFF